MKHFKASLVQENDKAVMAAYGFKSNMEESEIVAELFRLYEGMVK